MYGVGVEFEFESRTLGRPRGIVKVLLFNFFYLEPQARTQDDVLNFFNT